MDVIIRNFQSVVEAKMSWKGFTILIGESSQGKSSCLKAVYAATHNRFKIGQVRNGEDFAEIKVRFPEDDRVLVVRRRPTGSPDVRLGDQNFAKLARTVPPQVEEFCNFGYLEVSDDKYSLNFRSQFDKPLLLEYSQKKVMEILSASQAIDDLNKVHYALSKKREQNRGAFKHVDAVITEGNADLSMVKFEIKETSKLADELKERYGVWDKQNQELEILKTLESLVLEYNKVSNLKDIHYNITMYADNIIGMVDTCKSLESVKSDVLTYNQNANRFDILVKIKNAWKPELQQKYDELSNLVDLMVQHRELYDKIYPLSVKVSNLNTINLRIDKRNKLNSTSVLLQGLLTDLDAQSIVDKKVDELKDIVEGKKCPICGTIMNI